jgi:hypothetical protein
LVDHRPGGDESVYRSLTAVGDGKQGQVAVWGCLQYTGGDRFGGLPRGQRSFEFVRSD